jgi:hypothetical protein
LITFIKKKKKEKQKTVSKEKFLFCQDNCQGILVLHVDPRIYQDQQVGKPKFIKTQRGND